MNIKNIKKYLRTKIGSNIVVIYYGSRNRKERYDGYIWRLYRNVFTIKLKNNEMKCFSYNDILTKTIKLCR